MNELTLAVQPASSGSTPLLLGLIVIGVLVGLFFLKRKRPELYAKIMRTALTEEQKFAEVVKGWRAHAATQILSKPTAPPVVEKKEPATAGPSDDERIAFINTLPISQLQKTQLIAYVLLR